MTAQIEAIPKHSAENGKRGKIWNTTIERYKGSI